VTVQAASACVLHNPFLNPVVELDLRRPPDFQQAECCEVYKLRVQALAVAVNGDDQGC
jgi:hypothetical protein